MDSWTNLICIDLHDCSVNVSKVFLVYYLTSLAGSLHLSSRWETGKAHGTSPRERERGRGRGGELVGGGVERMKVLVITGKGNHVLSDGRRGVLREDVREFITKEMMMDVRVVDGNEGCLIVHVRPRDGPA